jgi:glutathione S-transferase
VNRFALFHAEANDEAAHAPGFQHLASGDAVCLGDTVRQDFGKYPKVKGWLGRMKALPAWKKVNEVAEGFAASLADKPLIAV